MSLTWLIDFAIYYMFIGYVVNNIIGLIALYAGKGAFGVDFGSFILTIPVWPYTLYQAIVGLLGKD